MRGATEDLDCEIGRNSDFNGAAKPGFSSGQAQAEMESYLRERYDLAAIFSAEGNDRNPLIKMFMVDIAVYHLFCAIAPRNIPQIRLDRYNAAIKWLDMVRKGQISPALPALQAINSTVNNSIFGSNTANGYSW